MGRRQLACTQLCDRRRARSTGRCANEGNPLIAFATADRSVGPTMRERLVHPRPAGRYTTADRAAEYLHKKLSAPRSAPLSQSAPVGGALTSTPLRMNRMRRGDGMIPLYRQLENRGAAAEWDGGIPESEIGSVGPCPCASRATNGDALRRGTGMGPLGLEPRTKRL